jgi:hypothetical protein
VSDRRDEATDALRVELARLVRLVRIVLKTALMTALIVGVVYALLIVGVLMYDPGPSTPVDPEARQIASVYHYVDPDTGDYVEVIRGRGRRVRSFDGERAWIVPDHIKLRSGHAPLGKRVRQ